MKGGISMKICEKLKCLNRKWIWVISIVIVLSAGGCIVGGILHERFEDKYGNKSLESVYSTCYNLLTLENSAKLKLSPEQSKAILPFLEKLPTADKTTQVDLVKSIYKQLTTEQYMSLITDDKKQNSSNAFNNKKERGGKRDKGREHFDGNRFEGRQNSSATMKQTIFDVVDKMLKEKAAK